MEVVFREIESNNNTTKFDLDGKIIELNNNEIVNFIDELLDANEYIILINKNNKSRKVSHKFLSEKNWKSSPYEYQKEGIEYGLNHDKWLLLDMPGLGKTLQMIYLAEELKAQDKIEHCLIICGIASLSDNWRKEIQKHSNESCVIIGERINKNGNRVWETINKRAEQLLQPINEFFVIINVESLRNEKILNAINKGPNKYSLMLFDECHKAKGWNSQQGSNLLELSADKQVAMTGTLLLNKPLDAYVPLAWIGVEKKRGVTKFKNTYCVFDVSTKGRIIGYKNLDILKDEIDSCSLRRTKDLLDLPEKNFVEEFLTMEDAQDKFYENIKNSVKEEYKQLAKDDCDKIKLNTTNLLALTTRLRQATTCPSVLTSQDITSCKIDRACDLVEEIVSNGNKVVIMSTFKEPVYKLQKLLESYNPLIGTGDMKDIDVSNNIDKFQSDDKYKVFIGTISKMGTGFTLTSASYMVFIDLPWTYALFEQACDRIHRIGSKKPVFIYSLICKDTIDEVTLQAIDTKKAFSDYVIDDKKDDTIMNILQKYLQDL